MVPDAPLPPLPPPPPPPPQATNSVAIATLIREFLFAFIFRSRTLCRRTAAQCTDRQGNIACRCQATSPTEDNERGNARSQEIQRELNFEKRRPRINFRPKVHATLVAKEGWTVAHLRPTRSVSSTRHSARWTGQA